MAADWTTTELLAAIREEGRIPDDDTDATDSKLLLEADRVLVRKFVPAIRKAREDYYLDVYDISLVADQFLYKIPHRATTNSVRAVLWVDTNSKEHDLGAPTTLVDSFLSRYSGAKPTGWAIFDDKIRVLPTPSTANGTLRVVYERRPSTLVADTTCHVLSSVTDNGDGTYNLVHSVNASAFTPADDGTVYDIVGKNPPFSLPMGSFTLDSYTSGTRTLVVTPGAYDSLPEVGDYFCLENETPIPQIPPEFHPLLSLKVASKWLLPIDPDAAMVMREELEIDLRGALDLLSSRKQGKQTPIRPSTSMFRRGARRGGYLNDWQP